MDIFEAIYRRRAIRHFSPDPIPDWVVEKVLDAGRFAPSAENQQPWRFIIVKDDESKKFLADLAEETARKHFGETPYVEFHERLWYIDRNEAHPRIIEPMMTGEEERFVEKAAVNIVMLWGSWLYQDYVHHSNLEAYLIASRQSVCMAVQNMWLATAALGGSEQKYGMGVQLIMGLAQGRFLLHDYFGIPPNWTPQGVISLGVPKFRREFGPARFPHEGLVYDDYWGVPYKRLAFRSDKNEADTALGKGRVGYMDALECIYTRRSIRRFKPDPIPEWKLEQVLDAARWAPSGENLQTWRFIVIRDKETKKMLADIAQEQSRVTFGAYPYNILDERLWYVNPEKRPRVIEPLRDGTLERFCEEAPYSIMVLRGRTWHECMYPVSEWAELHSNMMIPFSVQNLLLAAKGLGLGAVPATMPFTDRRRVDKIVEHLGVPHWWDPAFIVPLGIPKEARLMGPPRFPLESITYNEHWGVPYKRLAFARA